MNGIKDIIAKLGLDGKDGLFFRSDEQWKKEISFPNRVRRLIDKTICPDAFFCFDNKPLILFFEEPSNRQALYEAVWNFNESPIIIIADKGQIEIYNGFLFVREQKSLYKFGGAEKLNDFSYLELVTGRIWEQYRDEFIYKNRVDYYLLQNIKAARMLLVHGLNLDSKIANSLIGKTIFVRYLIDREVKLNFGDVSKCWTNEDFCALLDNPSMAKSFFDYLEDSERGFNGDLFPISDIEYGLIQKSHYNIIRRLLQGEDLEASMPSLFEFYDFSIIPIEFISNVYELFIGKNNQEREGAYYTPLFLVDYILKETVEEKLRTSKTTNCRVLDPACGSGIFLVETLRKIIEKYMEIERVDPHADAFKNAIKQLVIENIFGVDKDLSAVQVAIFSVYLTLLDYLDPPEIENFKFPNLLNSNFFNADFFDLNNAFNACLSNVKFDYILGNPPWMRGKGEKMKPLYVRYIEQKRKLEKEEPVIDIGNREIAQAFILRSADFSTIQTKCALIVTSKVLYNLKSVSFRTYFLHNFFLDRVFELAPVRKEVFDKSNDKVVAPACVLFFSSAKGKSTDLNIVEHISLKQSRFFSLFKIFTINKTDYKHIQQSKLKQCDWLWKVLVYGSYLDFNFINRLRTEYTSIKDIVSDGNNFVEGTGIQYSSDEKYDASHLNGLSFVDATGITPFFVDPEKISTFIRPKVHRKRDERIFNPPVLLIRKGLNMQTLTAYCAICYRKILFKDSITGISVINHELDSVLANIASLLTSKLFSYFAVNTFSSIGIEREQTQSEDKYCLPYLELNTSDSVMKIEKASQSIYEETRKTLKDNIKIASLEKEINDELQIIDTAIVHKLNMSDVESALIDYTCNVNRVLIVGNDTEKRQLFSPLVYNDIILNIYASIFLERFKSKLDNVEKRFVVEVWYTKQIVGMFFKMIPAPESEEPIMWIDKQDCATILAFLSQMGSEKITDKLFVQKDIRGFDNNGNDFYIVKPNEKRLWHKAIGYLDVNEFADAIIRAGRATH